MARLTNRLAAIICLTLASIYSSAQTSVTDSLQALAGTGTGQQLNGSGDAYLGYDDIVMVQYQLDPINSRFMT